MKKATIAALFCSIACFPAEKPKANDTVTITTFPEAAQVEWNRVSVGVAPINRKVGEYAFNSSKNLYSKRLSQPLTIRVSKEGYVTKEVIITKELTWTSVNGRNRFILYIITSNNFHIELDKVSAVRVALTNDAIVKLKAAGFGDELIIDKIKTQPAAFNLEIEDMVELRKAGLSDAVVQAMIHAQ